MATELLNDMLRRQAFHAVNSSLFDDVEEIRSDTTRGYTEPLPLLPVGVWEHVLTEVEASLKPMEQILPMYHMGYRYLVAQHVLTMEDGLEIGVDYIIERIEGPLRWRPVAVSYLIGEESPFPWDVEPLQSGTEPLQSGTEPLESGTEPLESVTAIEVPNPSSEIRTVRIRTPFDREAGTHREDSKDEKDEKEAETEESIPFHYTNECCSCMEPTDHMCPSCGDWLCEICGPNQAVCPWCILTEEL